MSSLLVASSQAPTDFDVHQVMNKACQQASHSWEYGTAAEALLQLYNPELSVFSKDPFPGGSIPSSDISETPSLLYAKKFIRIGRKTLIDGGGSAGDPASLGNYCLLIGQTELGYDVAAKDQASFILDEVPRWSNGAISHREDVAELWADSISMVPPFLSYRAVAIDDQTLLREACRQCQLYEEILRPQTCQPLWQHIVGPQAEDIGQWSTGNGWVAAGLCRTLATMKKWGKSKGWVVEQDRLRDSIMGILKGVVLVSETKDPILLRNYLDDTTSYRETAGTALLGAVAYRMAVLIPEIDNAYIAFADACWRSILAHTDKECGTIGPTVDPLNCRSPEPIQGGSSEGHSFAVMLFAARRDYMTWCVENEIKDWYER